MAMQDYLEPKDLRKAVSKAAFLAALDVMAKEIKQLRHRVESLEAKSPEHRGTWRFEEEYEPGNQVTCGGESYIALRSTKACPIDSPDWRSLDQ